MAKGSSAALRPPPPPPGSRAEVRIHDLNSEGEGVSRLEGWVVFVPGTVPQDLAEVELGPRRGNRLEARLVQLKEPSPRRVDPVCPHQGECGGCPLMVLDPVAGLEYKVRHLVETLRRIGGLTVPPPRVLASPRNLEYRGRVRFAVNGPRFGFRPRGAGEGFVAVSRCWLIEARASGLARLFLESLSALDPPRQRPWPTQIELRGSPSRGSWLLVARTPAGSFPELASLARGMVEEQTGLAGVLRREEFQGGGKTTLLAGRAEVEEQIGGLPLACGAEGFLQVNPQAAGLLYREARAMARAGGAPARVLDLFCGAGLAGVAVAGEEAELWGVDRDPSAVGLARKVAAAAGTARVRFAAADARAWLRELSAAGEKFTVVIANPPRAGVGADLAPALCSLGPEKIILISCHPATLARDLAGFSGRGYRLAALSAVDMFPQTPHLEAVACLTEEGP